MVPKKCRPDFVDSVIQSAREGSDVKGLYFQNDVESMHFLEKLNQDFKKESTTIAIESLSQIAERQNLEEIRAIFHGGRYVLSQQYKKFSVESSVWHSWSEERRMDHVKKFREYIPSISDSFSKPSNSGRKPGQQKRNRKRQEPDIVIDRHEATTSESLAAASQAVGPSQSQAAVPSGSESQATSAGEIRFKDPRVNPPKEFELHLRNKLSKKISKCQGKCGKPISDKDFMIIRTYGSSSYTDKESGENKCKYGPLYIHFEGKCLKAFDSKKFY